MQTAVTVLMCACFGILILIGAALAFRSIWGDMKADRKQQDISDKNRKG